MTIDDRDGLRQHYLFAVLDDAPLGRVLAAVQEISLEEGDHLFNAGDQARYFYLLRTGQIQLYRLSPGGEEKVIEIIQPGQTFAEAVMFLKTNTYPVSAKAIVSSGLWRIDMAVFLSILQESSELCLRLLGSMSRRLHGAIQDIDQLTLQNAGMRVIQLLLHSAPDSAANRYSLEWETPKQILASRLSVRPETFSRILQRLSRQGLITVQGKMIEVLDAKALRRALDVVG
ncbi:MAG: Crp/Fnr family transcriptional regulator [Methylomicrobium sp.]|jgi:CRP-like cAMP-binding protein